MVLKLLGELVGRSISLREHYGGLYHLSPDRVGNRGNGAFHNRRMFHKNAFYLKWTDAVSGALYKIVGSSDIPEVSVFITPCVIRCMIVTVVHYRLSLCRISKVFHKETWEISVFHVYNNFTNFTVFYFVSFFVYQSNVVIRSRFS